MPAKYFVFPPIVNLVPDVVANPVDWGGWVVRVLVNVEERVLVEDVDEVARVVVRMDVVAVPVSC